MVAAGFEEWDSERIAIEDNKKPSQIRILEDEAGICDVQIAWNKWQKTSLAGEKSCTAKQDGIKQTSIRLDDKTPLVGLHGYAAGERLVSLGLIYADTDDKECQHALKKSEIDLDDEDDQTIEDQITEKETHRAEDLEAILIYGAM